MNEDKIQDAAASPSNQGEMPDADAVGTVGSPECGDMVRMWVKFRQDDAGEKVIDQATFQSFGCQTALAVASVATEMIAGKTVDEALKMDASDLSAPLGPLPPMKIHCGQMVEGALRDALEQGEGGAEKPATAPMTPPAAGAPTLSDSLQAPSFPAGGKIRIVKLDDDES